MNALTAEFARWLMQQGNREDAGERASESLSDFSAAALGAIIPLGAGRDPSLTRLVAEDWARGVVRKTLEVIAANARRKGGAAGEQTA
jgi:hypothetical protein